MLSRCGSKRQGEGRRPAAYDCQHRLGTSGGSTVVLYIQINVLALKIWSTYTYMDSKLFRYLNFYLKLYNLIAQTKTQNAMWWRGNSIYKLHYHKLFLNTAAREMQLNILKLEFMTSYENPPFIIRKMNLVSKFSEPYSFLWAVRWALSRKTLLYSRKKPFMLA